MPLREIATNNTSFFHFANVSPIIMNRPIFDGLINFAKSNTYFSGPITVPINKTADSKPLVRHFDAILIKRYREKRSLSKLRLWS